MNGKVQSGPVETGVALGSLDIDGIKRMIPHRYPFLS